MHLAPELSVGIYLTQSSSNSYFHITIIEAINTIQNHNITSTSYQVYTVHVQYKSKFHVGNKLLQFHGTNNGI